MSPPAVDIRNSIWEPSLQGQVVSHRQPLDYRSVPSPVSAAIEQ